MKKRKNGFTLIELLAVIVILAVIALIATPFVTGAISKAKIGSAKDSMYGYVKAIENELIQSIIDNKTTIDGTYTLKDKTFQYGENVINPDIKGTKAESGYVIITNGNITESCLKINNYNILYNGENADKQDKECDGGSINPPVETAYKEAILAGNDPVLAQNMVRVKVNDDGTGFVVADKQEEWYNYANKKWANVVVLKSDITKSVGESVDMSTDIELSLVWIPRYEYKMNGKEEAIAINFTTIIFVCQQ